MPRARSTRDEDDDVRPRSRLRTRVDDPPRARKRVPPALILGLAAGALVVLVAVVIVLVVVVRDAGKPASVDLLVYAPSDALIVSGYDVESLWNRDNYRKPLERWAPLDIAELDQAGVRTADLSRLMVARTPGNGSTCAIRFKTAPERSKYLGPDLTGKTYAPFTSLTGNYKFGYFADKNTLVLADKENTIQALLDKGPKIRVSSELKDMIDRARGQAWRASGRIPVVEQGRLGNVDDGFAFRVGASAGTVVWLEASSYLTDVKLELHFDSAYQARTGATTLRGFFVQQRGLNNEFGGFGRQTGEPADFNDIRQGYEAAEVNESGRRVTARLRLPATEAMRVVGSARN